jgi:hypothetical protein
MIYVLLWRCSSGGGGGVGGGAHPPSINVKGYKYCIDERNYYYYIKIDKPFDLSLLGGDR